MISRKNIAGFLFNLSPFQGRPGFLVIQYIGYLISGIQYFYAQNWVYSIHSRLIWGCGGGFLKLVLHDF